MDNKKMTDEEKAAAKLARQKNATGKKRRNITVLTKTEDVTLSRITNNEGLRTIADVKKWMEEKNFIGTVYPVRMQKGITRAEQTVVKFS